MRAHYYPQSPRAHSSQLRCCIVALPFLLAANNCTWVLRHSRRGYCHVWKIGRVCIAHSAASMRPAQRCAAFRLIGTMTGLYRFISFYHWCVEWEIIWAVCWSRHFAARVSPWRLLVVRRAYRSVFLLCCSFFLMIRFSKIVETKMRCFDMLLFKFIFDFNLVFIWIH